MMDTDVTHWLKGAFFKGLRGVNEASSCLGKLEVVREGRREANDASCNEHTLSELPASLSLS